MKTDPPTDAPSGLRDAACSPGDIINGLLHTIDDHPCCRSSLYAAANLIAQLEQERDDAIGQLAMGEENMGHAYDAVRKERDEARAMARDMRNQLEKPSPARLLFPWENAERVHPPTPDID